MGVYLWLYIYAVIFIAGLCFGSYMNVLIYRIPRGIGTIAGRSFCPDCGHKLGWLDLFPVFSYIFLGGRCRYCKTPISPRYAAVELLNALLWLAYAYKFMLYPLTMAGHFIFGSALLCIIFIDAEHMLIFDRFNIAIAFGGVLIALDKYLCDNVLDYVYPSSVTIADRLIGAVCVSGVFLLIALLSRSRAMGGGDIKLTAAAGLVLGWKNMLVMLVLASAAGAVGSLLWLAVQKRRAKLTPVAGSDAPSAASGAPTAGSDASVANSGAPVANSDATTVEPSAPTAARVAPEEDADGGAEPQLGHAVPFGPYLAGAMLFVSFFGAELVSAYLRLCGF